MPRVEEDEVAPGRQLLARERKRELEGAKLLCGRCRYHRGENRTHVSPHADVRKSKRKRQAQG